MHQYDEESKTSAQTGHKPWIRICVEMLDHPIVGINAPSPKPADPTKHWWCAYKFWNWALSEAAWKHRTRRLDGRNVALARGQLAISLRHLSREANWTMKAARRFLERLRKHDMIGLSQAPGSQMSLDFAGLCVADGCPKRGTGVTIISICNYRQYQDVPQKKGTARAQQGHSKGTGRAQYLTEYIDDNPVGARARAHEGEAPPPEENTTGASAESVLVKLDERRADVAAILTEDHYRDFRELCDSFGRNPDEPAQRPTPREQSDRLLSSLVRSELRDDCEPTLARRAIEGALRNARAASMGMVQNGHGTKRVGAGAALRYVERTLRSQVEELRLAEAEAVAKMRTEEAVQTMLAEKRAAGVGDIRAKPKSWSDLAAEVYGGGRAS